MSQCNLLKGLRHPWDILVEMSRRKLDMSLELRGEITTGFGCDQCTTVSNAMDAMGRDKFNQENITEKSK